MALPGVVWLYALALANGFAPASPPAPAIAWYSAAVSMAWLAAFSPSIIEVFGCASALRLSSLSSSLRTTPTMSFMSLNIPIVRLLLLCFSVFRPSGGSPGAVARPPREANRPTPISVTSVAGNIDTISVPVPSGHSRADTYGPPEAQVPMSISP